MIYPEVFSCKNSFPAEKGRYITDWLIYPVDDTTEFYCSWFITTTWCDLSIHHLRTRRSIDRIPPRTGAGRDIDIDIDIESDFVDNNDRQTAPVFFVSFVSYRVRRTSPVTRVAEEFLCVFLEQLVVSGRGPIEAVAVARAADSSARWFNGRSLLLGHVFSTSYGEKWVGRGPIFKCHTTSHRVHFENPREINGSLLLFGRPLRFLPRCPLLRNEYASGIQYKGGVFTTPKSVSRIALPILIIFTISIARWYG